MNGSCCDRWNVYTSGIDKVAVNPDWENHKQTRPGGISDIYLCTDYLQEDTLQWLAPLKLTALFLARQARYK
jgi:hypothetical protein